MRIEAHEAVVKTTQVEVKTLTISGKQVTLAVFRQLQEEPLIDLITGQLRGVPWGRVNYHPDKCASDEPHMHVVWQHGSELRRSHISLAKMRFSRHQTLTVKLSATMEEWVAAQLWTDTRLTKDSLAPRDDDRKFLIDFEAYTPSMSVHVGNLILRFNLPKGLGQIADQYYRTGYLDKSSLSRLGYSPIGEAAMLELDRHISDAVNDYFSIRRIIQDQYAALEALDQLFIAV